MTYEVVARYMDGTSVVGYRFRNSMGQESDANTALTMQLINAGLVTNMRLRNNKDPETGRTTTDIRGKGINLLNLPRYDVNKAKFNEPSKPNRKIHAKYRITKRIVVPKIGCVGYAIADSSGREVNISLDKALELCKSALISNAAERKVPVNNEKNEYRQIIVGIGESLQSLPTIYIDSNGNKIDTTKKNQVYTLRAARMKRGGIVYNEAKGTKDSFSLGDYLLITPNGSLKIMKAKDIANKIRRSQNSRAICDDNLDNLYNFSVELYGDPKVVIQKQMALRWAIVDVMI